MNRCPELAVEEIDNLNIDESKAAHGFFSTGADGPEQECEFAQRGDKGV